MQNVKKLYVITVVGILPIIAGIISITKGDIIRGLSLLVMGVSAPIALIYPPTKKKSKKKSILKQI